MAGVAIVQLEVSRIALNLPHLGSACQLWRHLLPPPPPPGLHLCCPGHRDGRQPRPRLRLELSGVHPCVQGRQRVPMGCSWHQPGPA